MRNHFRKLFQRLDSSDRKTKEAIEAISHHVPARLIHECMDYVRHNEALIGLEILADWLVMHDVVLTRAEFDLLHRAMLQYCPQSAEMTGDLGLIPVHGESDNAIIFPTQTILSVLVTLLHKIKQAAPTNEEVAKIQEAIELNDLSKPEKVSKWFIGFFVAIVAERRTHGHVPYIHHGTEGDIWNFLVELEEIIPAQWRDEGEFVEIVFPFGITGVIWRMGDTYQIM